MLHRRSNHSDEFQDTQDDAYATVDLYKAAEELEPETQKGDSGKEAYEPAHYGTDYHEDHQVDDRTGDVTGQGTVLCPVYIFTSNLKLFY